LLGAELTCPLRSGAPIFGIEAAAPALWAVTPPYSPIVWALADAVKPGPTSASASAAKQEATNTKGLAKWNPRRSSGGPLNTSSAFSTALWFILSMNLDDSYKVNTLISGPGQRTNNLMTTVQSNGAES
jgi:hypothetical protein